MDDSFLFIVSQKNQRLDMFLSEQSQRSRMFIKSQIQQGNVSVNGRTMKKAGRVLRPGDRVEGIFHEKPGFDLKPLPGNLEILFEDDELLAINKRQGLIVHPAPSNKGETLVHHLLYHFQSLSTFTELSPGRPGITHRLDKDTSGILLVAKNAFAQEKLSAQFKNRTITKVYEGIVWGVTPLKGNFSSSIGRDLRDRKKMSSHTGKGREAFTSWRKLFSSCHFSHLELYPKTGRTHQLRVHLSEAGFPIVADQTYCRRRDLSKSKEIPPTILQALEEISGTLLHARSLTFEHPKTGKSLQLTAPLPDYFEKFLSLIRNFDIC